MNLSHASAAAVDGPATPVLLRPALETFLERFSGRVRDGSRSADTLDMHEKHVRWLLARLGDVPIVELTTSFLEGFTADAIARGGDNGAPLCSRTVAKRLTTLRQALELQHRLGELDRLPLFPEFYATPARRAELAVRTFADFRRLCACLPQDRADWVAVCLFTCQHASDVDRMRWADVELDPPEPRAPWMIIRNTKNRKPHGFRVKMPSPLVVVLRERRARLTAAGRPPRASDPLVGRWRTRSYVLPMAAVRAGLPPVTAISLRHTGLSWLIRRRGITFAAQAWAGHSSPKMMSEVYGHALPPQLDDCADELASVADEGGASPNT